MRLSKKAYTLAEVLITLGIIGVVAAMTLPALVNKYRTIVDETKVKKNTSDMDKGIKKNDCAKRRLCYNGLYGFE